MKTLPLKLYTSSPIKYLGTGNLQIKHEGGSQIIKFFNEEEEVAEVKIEYRFDLGKYGDSGEQNCLRTKATTLRMR